MNKIWLVILVLLIIVILFFVLKKKNESNHVKTYYLSSEDFRDGTFVIKKPGTYVLTEDIVFNPNPEYDHLPRPYQLEKTKCTSYLGFNSCISVKTSCTIDLNHYSIKMSKAFYFKQRFFSHIELNCDDVEIINGKLGLSSHYCIHGNRTGFVKISNVYFEDYEITAIKINDPDKLIIEDCDFGPNFQKVPISSTFSSARQLVNLSKILYEETQDKDLYEKIQKLEKLTIKAFDQYMESNKVYVDLFKNKSGLPDGGV